MTELLISVIIVVDIKMWGMKYKKMIAGGLIVYEFDALYFMCDTE